MKSILHVFAGKVEKGTWSNGTIEKTLDIRDDLDVDYKCDVLDAPKYVPHKSFDLVLADPPYAEEDARKYGTCLVNRKAAMEAIHPLILTGGHVVWLDQVLPMYKKSMYSLIGTIGIVRSTNHRVRMVFIFRKI